MARTCGAVAAIVLLATTAHAQLTQVERQRLAAHLAVTAASLEAEVTSLTPAQLAFKPAPGHWSIAEVLDHLVLVSQVYWDDLQAALKSPPSEQRSAFTDADILWYGIDRTDREKAIAPELPAGKFDSLGSMLARYRKNHARLVEFVRTTDADLRGRIVSRQGSDAYQWALLISAHEQRHILQIREIKSAPKFPVRKDR